MKTVISTPKAPAAIGPYSQAIRKGGTLYLSGQIGMVPATGELVSNDVKEQAAQALANMKAGHARRCDQSDRIHRGYG